MKKILCIIPARKGSKGIKNKNTQNVTGNPLIQYSINFAKKLSKTVDICVSTDSKKIKKIIEANSLNFYGFRPKKLCTDQALTIDVVKYELKKLEKKYRKEYEYILLLQPTCPIRKINHLNKIIKNVKSKKNNYNCGISLQRVNSSHPLRMKIIKNGYVKNFIPSDKEDMRPRQKLPPVYIRSGSYYFINKKTMLRKNSLVGDKCFGYILDDLYATNIDNIDDLNLLRLKIKK